CGDPSVGAGWVRTDGRATGIGERVWTGGAVGKMPTTSARRRISLEGSERQQLSGGQHRGARPTLGNLSVSASSTRTYWGVRFPDTDIALEQGGDRARAVAA